MKVSTSFMAGWLSGFWDGEGSIVFRQPKANSTAHTTYYLSVGNTDMALIVKARAYLDALRIDFTEFEQRSRPPRKPFYVFHICKAEAILRFAALIPLFSPEKENRLANIITWINRPKYVERFALTHEQVLRDLYPIHTIRCITNQLGMRPGGHHRVTLAIKHLGLWQPKLHQGVACHCMRA